MAHEGGESGKPEMAEYAPTTLTDHLRLKVDVTGDALPSPILPQPVGARSHSVVDTVHIP